MALLVLAAEFGCPREQFVLDGDRRSPAELRVERAQQRILAARGGGEIGRAVDDAIVGDEHAATVCEPTDSSARVADELDTVAVPPELHHARSLRVSAMSGAFRVGPMAAFEFVSVGSTGVAAV
jgi:hypothetical protein